MKTPIFLDIEDVLRMHEDQIQTYGGSSGLRDLSLLQSALAMPAAGFGDEYFHKDLFEMAAAYMFHIIKNHPFVDGNKRTGAEAAFIFLKFNGLILKAPTHSFEKLAVEVAEGKADKTKAAEFFRKHSTGK